MFTTNYNYRVKIKCVIAISLCLRCFILLFGADNVAITGTTAMLYLF